MILIELLVELEIKYGINPHKVEEWERLHSLTLNNGTTSSNFVFFLNKTGFNRC